MPRLNVTVTHEQHALLLELAELNGGSAAGYLRQMLDQATPLLRATVPALRIASKEMELTREKAATIFEEMMSALETTGAADTDDLFDFVADVADGPAASRERAASGSERALPARRQSRK